MSKLLQLRGGTTSEHSTFTGALREVTVDTTKDSLVVHDGATAGGFPLATTADIGSTIQAYDADTTKNDVANTFTATQTLPAIKLTTGAGADKVLTSDAAGDATWAAPAPAGTTVALVSGTTQTAVKDTHYTLTNAALTTVTLPASPASGDTVWVTPANSVLTNVIARNGQTIMDIAQDLTIDVAKSTVRLRFTDSSWRLV